MRSVLRTALAHVQRVDQGPRRQAVDLRLRALRAQHAVEAVLLHLLFTGGRVRVFFVGWGLVVL